MGCIISAGNLKGNQLELNNEIIYTNANQTLDNGSLIMNPGYSFSNQKLKSLFQVKNNNTNTLSVSKTNCSTSLFHTLNETLILKFSKEFNQDYEIISIRQNVLKNKNKDIEIVKECPTHAIFSFGGEIPENLNKSVNSSSFQSSHFNENENIDFIFDDNKTQPHQFDIEYINGKYYMKGYNDGNGIFLRVYNKIEIEKEIKYIFLFNHKSFLNVLIEEEKGLIFFDYNGENKGEFNFKENNLIFIGRSQNCNIILSNEEGVSRVQFTFFYDKDNNKFYIFDGFYSLEDKKIVPSTNGIWLLMNNNKYPIENDMIFKTGKTIILCQFKED